MMYDLMINNLFDELQYLANKFTEKYNLFERFDESEVPSFVDNGDSYTLTINDVYTDNIKIKVDEDNILTVNTEHKTENSSSTKSFSVSVPDDANIETIRAEVEGTVLTVSVKKNIMANKTTEIPIEIL